MTIRTQLAACAAASLFALGFAAAPAAAANIAPLSYSFAPTTQCGSWCYHDYPTTKLTDGLLGVAGWATNQGQEWDGWTARVVDIDFRFATAQNFGSVTVGSTQDQLNDVVLPNLNIFSSLNGVNWTFQGSLNTPASSANDVYLYSTAPHGFLTVGGLNFTAPYVRVQAVNNGPWIFVDEVTFQGSGGVPEPATWGLMILGFGAAGSMIRRRRSLAA